MTSKIDLNFIVFNILSLLRDRRGNVIMDEMLGANGDLLSEEENTYYDTYEDVVEF